MADLTPLNLILRTRDGEPWAISKKIFDILHTYLQPNTALSPTDVAIEIDKLYPLKRPRDGDKENEEPVSFLLEMWEVVIGIADQIPWNHPGQDRLIQVVAALQDLPEPIKVETDSGWGVLEIWSGLPLIGLVMTENGSKYGIDLNNTSEAQEAIRKREQNFVAFTARLTQTGLVDRSQHFSIRNLQEALEVEPDKRSRAYLKQGPQLDVYVPLAGIWILLAGDVIFSHCRTPPEINSNTPAYAGRANWMGKDGFSIERWNFWKQRFGEIKVYDQVSEKTKQIASQSEKTMTRIEIGTGAT